MPKNPFLGTWRIVHMDEWDNDYLDLVVPAFLKVEKDNSGSFQFGTVQGWLDHRLSSMDGQPRLEWSWEGLNDNDQGCGRGWAVLEGTGLKGHLFIHGSDDSAFMASPYVTLVSGRSRLRPSSSRKVGRRGGG